MRVLEIRPGVLSVAFDERARRVLLDMSYDLCRSSADFDEPEFLDVAGDAGRQCGHLLPEIAELLGEISEHEGASVLALDLGPETVADVGHTPSCYRPRESIRNLYRPDMLRGLIVGMAGWYGYGYLTQQHGVVHNNIIPIREYARVRGISAAELELGLHTEDASFNVGPGRDISPDFLTLHFFKNRTMVPTMLSRPDWDRMPAGAIDVLSEAWYVNRTNPGQGGETSDPSVPVSVIYGPGPDRWIRFNAGCVDFGRYEARQVSALRELMANLAENSVELSFRAGQIVLIDNRRVLHGRARYTRSQLPSYDGTDRWQRRLVVSQDRLRLAPYEIGPRLLDPARLLRPDRHNRS